ncbi:MAG: hypothetical protein AAF193_01430, partial [Bacteroidota bacterium]
GSMIGMGESEWITTVPSIACGSAGTEVVLTVTDEQGNSSTCTANVTVEDNMMPTAVCAPLTIEVNQAMSTEITAMDVDGGSTDNCGIESMMVSPSSFSYADIGDQTVTLTVTDTSGNVATCTTTVTVECADNDGDGVCDADEIVGCQDTTACNYDVTATDAGDCDYLDACGVCGGSGTLAGCTDNTANNYDPLADCDDGSCTYCTLDFTCPTAATYQCVDEVPAGDANDIVVNDACGTVNVTWNDVTTGGGCPSDPMVITRTYTVTDGVSTSTCDVVYQVADTTPPTLTCPADVQLNAGDALPTPLSTMPGSDNCAGEVVLSSTWSGMALQSGFASPYVVDLELDGDYNSGTLALASGTCDGTLTLTSNPSPNVYVYDFNTATCLTGCVITIEILPNGDVDYFHDCGAVTVVGVLPLTGQTFAPGSQDSFAVTNVTDNPISNDGCVEIIERTYEAEDLCGNTATCIQTITIQGVEGCTDATACNYNAAATCDNSSCVFADEPCESCSGETDGTGVVVLSDADGDGVCDGDEIVGCQDATACNYNMAATDAAPCEFADEPCESCSGETDGTGVVVLSDTDGDGVCDADEIAGCQDATACNYNMAATDAAPCEFADEPCESCSGETDGTGVVVLSDADGDGVCDADEIAGCQDATACNYNMAATDAGTCVYVTEACDFCSGETDGTGVVVDGDANDNGICDIDEGCTYPNACNYDAVATIEDGSCVFPGCTSFSALNFDPSAACDDGSCIFPNDFAGDCAIWDANLEMFVQDPNCECSAGCVGDFNDDNTINAADLLTFLGIFGTSCN